MDEATVKCGLLLEAVEAQQASAATALERLREHTAGLDGIVRDEIRATLVEELRTLAEDTQHAAHALRALSRRASLRLAVWSIAITALSAAIPLAVAYWALPSRAEVARLHALRDELTANIAGLQRAGGRIDLRRCGATQRLCVRIEHDAPAYGTGADYLVLKGY